MLFFCAGTVTVQDDPATPEEDSPLPYEVTIPGNTILINTRAVHKDYCQLEMLMTLTMLLTTACALADEINVISREDGSGTRGAFIKLFGIEQKNA